MGYTLPTPDSAAESARTLIARKEAIELEIETHASVLRANGTNMSEPLIDREGFPRADLDIWAVRNARVRIIELRNDLKTAMDDVAKALERVYDRSAQTGEGSGAEQELPKEEVPFAKVNGVAPGSPAADAGLLRGDLVLKFGDLKYDSFSEATLQLLSELVGKSENKAIRIQVQRDSQKTYLVLTPRQGWGGRGMLGCHIVPYTPS
ncbi:hypothetical protein FA95DRAFT_1555751 [Auriscalpium vulgare]|uniref:Uncharacterized protein n=1 Tax=Auriscalpium vulgare TaxID=40419 RepID=A0ACB8S3F5_9AGAM|nr:hypothetical protein FA95DRAFT_1555751 [Auriscalpium vulgare]